MALAELKKKISADLSKKIKEIEKRTADEIKKIEEETKAVVQEYEKAKNDAFAREKKELSLREDALVELEGNKIIQEAKKKAIDSVFDELRQKLINLSKAEKTKILKSLVKRAESEIEVSTVYVSEQDKALIKGSKSEDIIGGIIAENKDGTVRVDYSFDSLLDEFRTEILSEVSEKLFS